MLEFCIIGVLGVERAFAFVFFSIAHGLTGWSACMDGCTAKAKRSLCHIPRIYAVHVLLTKNWLFGPDGGPHACRAAQPPLLPWAAHWRFGGI